MTRRQISWWRLWGLTDGRLDAVLTGVTVALLAWSRFAHLANGPWEWDEVAFARGVYHFDLAAYDAYAENSGLEPRSADNLVVTLQNGGGIRQNAGPVLPVGGVDEQARSQGEEVHRAVGFGHRHVAYRHLRPAHLDRVPHPQPHAHQPYAGARPAAE